jgi:hypothetical protein
MDFPDSGRVQCGFVAAGPSGTSFASFFCGLLSVGVVRGPAAVFGAGLSVFVPVPLYVLVSVSVLVCAWVCACFSARVCACVCLCLVLVSVSNRLPFIISHGGCLVLVSVSSGLFGLDGLSWLLQDPGSMTHWAVPGTLESLASSNLADVYAVPGMHIMSLVLVNVAACRYCLVY